MRNGGGDKNWDRYEVGLWRTGAGEKWEGENADKQQLGQVRIRTGEN